MYFVSPERASFFLGLIGAVFLLFGTAAGYAILACGAVYGFVAARYLFGSVLRRHSRHPRRAACLSGIVMSAFFGLLVASICYMDATSPYVEPPLILKHALFC